MSSQWTRRQFLARVGVAAAAIQTVGQLDLCCVLPADAATGGKDLFEFKQVGDGIYAAIAAPQYKVNSNAAVILTNDGVVVVDSHPSHPRRGHSSKKSGESAINRSARSSIPISTGTIGRAMRSMRRNRRPSRLLPPSARERT